MTKNNRKDDLTSINGIGPKSESLLNKHGIRSYKQLAATSVTRINEILGRRVANKKWISTARKLDSRKSPKTQTSSTRKPKSQRPRGSRKTLKQKSKFTFEDVAKPIKGKRKSLPVGSKDAARKSARKKSASKKTVKKKKDRKKLKASRRREPQSAPTSRAPAIAKESLAAESQKKRKHLERKGMLLARKHPSVLGFNIEENTGKNQDTPKLKIYVKKKTKAVEKTIVEQKVEDDVEIQVDSFDSTFDLASSVTVNGGDKTNADFAPQKPGTVGVLVKAPIGGQDFRFLLTAAHVVRGSRSSVSSCCPIAMQKTGQHYGDARCNRSQTRFWSENSRVDAAMVFPSQETLTTRFVKPPTTQQPVPFKFRAPVPEDQNSTVRIWKRGMNGTGFGKIKKISASRPLSQSPGNSVADAVNHLLIERTSGEFAGGDSGAAIVLKDCVIGLLRAVSKDKKFILACRIDEVRDRLTPFDMYTRSS